MLNFIKMHGLGNDFVIIDGRKALPALTPEQIRLLCDRNRGVGCDQLIVMEMPQGEADVFMRIYNTDASEAGACGNATRCIADLIMTETGRDTITVQTISGLLACRRGEGGLITVDMGAPKLDWQDIPLARAADTLNVPLLPDLGGGVGVNMGNPHCVFFCEEAEDIPVERLGKAVETDALFPQRTNVEFVSLKGPDHLRMRVWERGAGITQACGSGACAVGVAAVRRGLTGRRVRISLDGGDLYIEWRENDGHVLMTGPVAYVFTGVFSGKV